MPLLPTPPESTSGVERAALSTILQNIVVDQQQAYVSPCRSSSNADDTAPIPIMESTSALLAVRALAKTSNGPPADNDYSALSWQILDSVLSAQETSGLIPRYFYPAQRHNDTEVQMRTPEYPDRKRRRSMHRSEGGPYLPNTAYPSPSLVGGEGTGVSVRISSPPFHASVALHAYYLSNQTDADLLALSGTYGRLYKYHQFFHEDIMRGCNFVGTDVSTSPCYNVIHPWESDAGQISPIWEKSLQLIKDKIDEEGWSAPFDVPEEVSISFDYPRKDTYDAILYLLECHRSASIKFESELCVDFSDPDRETDGNGNAFAFEEFLLKSCPFAILDVGNAAALARSDKDLVTIGTILRDEDIPRTSQPTRLQIDKTLSWSDRSSKVLDSLWDDKRSAYLSRTVVFDQNGPNATYTARNETMVLDVAVSSNFMPWWDIVPDGESRTSAMTFQLLQTEGDYAFNCAKYPIRSVGGCSPNNSFALIDPAKNYWVSSGMPYNGATGIGSYIQNSTLNLVCGLSNVERSNLTEACPKSTSFPAAYASDTFISLNKGGCGSTFTASAAAVYNIVVADKPFSYEPSPPISSSWVIFLIAIELAVALGIGISCVLLSMNMIHRLKAEDDGDAFVRLLRSQRANASFLYGDLGYEEIGSEEFGEEPGADFASLDIDDASASAAVGIGEELGLLQDNLTESPIVKASSPLSTVQRYLFGAGRAMGDGDDEHL